jgi:phosphate transport system substrate-binding protein
MMYESLDEPPTVTFDDDFPRLDGATAAYPVYYAMAWNLYQIGEYDFYENVKCSATADAYDRLIKNEIDIFFGAQPSKSQIEAARRKNLEFELTPIAKEAFVFFVNKDNPIDSLTVEQIQDIYEKKVTDWKEVGGNREKIMPFQRSEDSGSQTIMQAAVMKDRQLAKPLMQESAGLMEGIISEVAEYRNYTSAIGYSFRYYATVMNPSENIKLIAIDGVSPTVENIRNGTYPFTVDVYAVTVKERTKSPNTATLIEWILSEQGQRFIEKCGYVSAMNNE